MEGLLFVFIAAALLGLIPAGIAQSKGRDFGTWWFYGGALFIIALPHAMAMKALPKVIEQKQLAEGMKKCPFCAEIIKPEAIKCKHCGSDLPSAAAESAPSEPVVEKLPMGTCSNCVRVIPLGSAECPKCHALFGGASLFKIDPLAEYS